jgi:hypothetical protein
VSDSDALMALCRLGRALVERDEAIDAGAVSPRVAEDVRLSRARVEAAARQKYLDGQRAT